LFKKACEREVTSLTSTT